MRYWTIVTINRNILDEHYPLWKTLSEKEILDEYWDYWTGKMKEVGKEDVISEERCIEDWCILHFAERNHFRERMHNAI